MRKVYFVILGTFLCLWLYSINAKKIDVPIPHSGDSKSKDTLSKQVQQDREVNQALIIEANRALDESVIKSEHYKSIVRYNIDETEGNDLLYKLDQANAPWLVFALISILHDEKHTIRWRNYCVQHLASHHMKHRDEMSYRGVLSAIQLPDKDLKGIGIFSLTRIAEDTHDVRIVKDARQALDSFLSGRHDPDVCISAIRCIGILQLNEFVPDLNPFAASGDAPLQVRVAAVEVLGLLSAKESIPLLRKLSQENEPRTLREAATRTLAVLSKPSDDD